MSAVNPSLVRGYKIGTRFAKNLTAREISLYALGVGCNQDPMRKEDFQFTYENHRSFSALPSLTSQFSVLGLDIIHECPGLPDYDKMALLHGEQRIIVHQTLREGMELRSENKIVDIADKKSGALITIESITTHQKELVATNYASLFIRGIGGFGDMGTLPGVKYPKAENETPSKAISYPTAPNQAHIYRHASGDINPLHVDPVLAKEKGNFEKPILHGLCTLGFTV